jgi:hypothetical protein
MSGGALDYIYGRIESAAEDVEQYIERLEQGEEDEYFKPHPYYLKHYPDRKEFADEKLLKEAVLSRLRDAAKALRVAAVYAVRAEWLMSDDDGWQSFILNTDEELEKLNRPKGDSDVIDTN